MARRRMFSLDVVDTDTFLDLPTSSQALYFHLGMRADDEGFVSSPKRITAMISSSPDDLKLLAAKGFIIPFRSGVCVIRDWKKNNYLQNDRITETSFKKEKSMLSTGVDRTYQLVDTECIQNVSILYTQNRLDQNSSEQNSIRERADKPPSASRFAPPSVEDVREYCQESGHKIDAEAFIDHYTSNGWKVGGKSPMKDWKAAVRNWERRDKEKPPKKDNSIIHPAEAYTEGAITDYLDVSKL